MSKLLTPEEIMSAGSPAVFCDWESEYFETVRFSYVGEEEADQPRNSLLLTFRDRRTNENTSLLFRNVEMTYFPIITSWGDAQVLVQNKILAQHETKKLLHVFMRWCDGMEEPLFRADWVERAST
jgi:hypothetical protein